MYKYITCSLIILRIILLYNNFQMSNCPHNNPITELCIKPDCQYRLSAGCGQCFLQDHFHQEPMRVSVGELEDMVKQFMFPKKIKPFCKDIQEAFYNYFRNLKQMLKDMQNQIESFCKQVVNNVGFPYLSALNNFTTYKRIKNHDYQAITPSQMSQFINSTQDSSLMMKTSQQQKLYLSQIQKHLQTVSEIDYSICLVHHLLESHGRTPTFQYCMNNVQKINEIVSKIESKTGYSLKRSLQHQPIKPKYKVKHHFSETSNNSEPLQNLHSPWTLQKNNEITSNTTSSENKEFPKIHKTTNDSQKSKEQEESNSKTLKISEQRNQEVEKQQKPKKKRQRKYSIDNHLLLKQNNLQKRIAELKKNRGEVLREESEMTQTYETKTVINFDLPQIEEEDKLEINKEFEVIPINRRIEEPDVGSECVSPLLRKKRQFDKGKVQKENLKKDNGDKIVHKQTQQPNQKNNQVRQLSQQQELSYMLLTQSLSLETDKAIKLLEKALEESQNNLSAVQYLSFLYFESNNYQKCIKLCSKYIKKLSVNKEEQVQQSICLLLCNKSGSLNYLGRYSETVTLLQNYKYKNNNIMKNLGNAYLGLGKYSKAINLYKKVEKYDSEIAYSLSVCYYMKEQYMAAKLAIQSCIGQKTQQCIQLQKHITNKLLTNNTKKP